MQKGTHLCGQYLNMKRILIHMVSFNFYNFFQFIIIQYAIQDWVYPKETRSLQINMILKKIWTICCLSSKMVLAEKVGHKNLSCHTHANLDCQTYLFAKKSEFICTLHIAPSANLKAIFFALILIYLVFKLLM